MYNYRNVWRHWELNGDRIGMTSLQPWRVVGWYSSLSFSPGYDIVFTYSWGMKVSVRSVNLEIASMVPSPHGNLLTVKIFHSYANSVDVK